MIELNPLPNGQLPMGRIVWGHPMTRRAVIDDRTKMPKLDKSIQPVFETSFGLAIPKAGEQHWNQTAWGQLIWNEGVVGFPRGEFNAPTFSWKIVDGDSAIPNKKGKIPREQQGYAGHWILGISTVLAAPKAYKFNAQMGTLSELSSDKEIKCGDYGRVALVIKPNCDAQGNAQSPGVYINPTMFCLDQVGEAIVSESYNADPSVFGGTMTAAPAQAQAYAPPSQPQAQAATPPTPPVQNTAYMAPPKMYTTNGAQYTYEQLISFGWNDAQIQALG